MTYSSFTWRAACEDGAVESVILVTIGNKAQFQAIFDRRWGMGGGVQPLQQRKPSHHEHYPKLAPPQPPQPRHHRENNTKHSALLYSHE